MKTRLTASFAASLIALTAIAAGDIVSFQRVLKQPLPKVAAPVEPAAAGAGDAGDDEEVIRINTDLRSDAVRVVDRDGNPVPRRLTKDDIEVYDNGSEKSRVEFFERGNVPLLFGIVMDGSKSFAPLRDRVSEAGEVFVTSAKPTDMMMLARFAGNDTADQWIRRPLSPIGASPALALEDYRDAWYTTGGGSAVIDAIAMGVHQLQEGKKRVLKSAQGDAGKSALKGALQTLIVITDGEDRGEGLSGEGGSQLAARDLQELLSESDVKVFVLSYASCMRNDTQHPDRYRKSSQFLQDVVAKAGGEVFELQKPLCTDAEARDASRQAAAQQEISTIATRINSAMRDQYLIGYYPNDIKRDGSSRTVKIRIRESVRAEIKAKFGVEAIATGYSSSYSSDGNAEAFRAEQQREADQAAKREKAAAELSERAAAFRKARSVYTQIQRIQRAAQAPWAKSSGVDAPTAESSREIREALASIASESYAGKEYAAFVAAAEGWVAAYDGLVKLVGDQEARRQEAERAAQAKREEADRQAEAKRQESERQAQAKRAQASEALTSARKLKEEGKEAESLAQYDAVLATDPASAEALSEAMWLADRAQAPDAARVVKYATALQAVLKAKLAEKPAGDALRWVTTNLAMSHWIAAKHQRRTNAAAAVAQVRQAAAFADVWAEEPALEELAAAIVFEKGYKRTPEPPQAVLIGYAKTIVQLWGRALAKHEKAAKPNFAEVKAGYVKDLQAFIPFSRGVNAKEPMSEEAILKFAREQLAAGFPALPKL